MKDGDLTLRLNKAAGSLKAEADGGVWFSSNRQHPGHCSGDMDLESKVQQAFRPGHVVCAIVPCIVVCRSNLAVKLLSDLRCYRITAVGIEAVKSKTSQKEAAQRLTKQQAAKVRKREADIGDAETVSIVSVSSGQIESTPFFHYLDIMVNALSLHLQITSLGRT